MREIEILVKVFDSKKVALSKLKKFKSKGVKKTYDIYFYDPKLEIKKNIKNPNFRLRKKDDKCYMTYKKDYRDKKGKWIYSDEHEIEISDFDDALKIINHLGLKPLVEVENKKHTFLKGKYEIVLEDVKNLGLFLEVEKLKVSNKENVANLKKEIQKFINSLEIKVGKELNLGKPELILNKNNHP